MATGFPTEATALETLTKGINAGDSCVKLSDSSIKLFNSISGTSKEIWQKARPLEITIVNLSQELRLQMDTEWFSNGRLWSYPAETIQPGCSITFYACNIDLSMAGVSGGVSFKVIQTNGDAYQPQFICTFSNPFMGTIKGLSSWCPSHKTEIKTVWRDMWDCAIIREPLHGFYRKDNTSLVFIFKEKDIKW